VPGQCLKRDRGRMGPNLLALVEAGWRMTAERIAPAGHPRHGLWVQPGRSFEPTRSGDTTRRESLAARRLTVSRAAS